MDGKDFKLETGKEPFPLLSAQQDESVERDLPDIEVQDKTYIKEFQTALDAVIELDPSLGPTVDKHVFPSFLESAVVPGSYEYLARSVISQQVSGYAAKAICGRVVALFGESFPTPEQVLEIDFDTLKEAGLSTRKTEYIRSLAQSYADGVLSDAKLKTSSDDEVVDMIVSIRGFGPWTAQMFLLFWLKRMNVFSLGDLGVQRGYKRYVQDRPELLARAKTIVVDVEDPRFRPPGTSAKARKREKLAKELEHMEAVASLFSPHRSALQVILWKLSDIVMDTVELRTTSSNGKRKQSEPKPRRNKLAKSQ